MKRARILIAAMVVALGCRNESTAPDTPIEMFDAFWTTFDREYSYFEHKRIDWNAARTVFRPRALAVTSEEDLINVALRPMVAPLFDQHVWFIQPDGTVEATHVPGKIVNWHRLAWLQVTGRCGFVLVIPDVGHCWMDGVAYVFIGTWNDSRLSVVLLDALVDHYRDAPAMIIDVRTNGGGADNLPLALAGRFATSETTIGYISYRNGPGHADFGPQVPRRVSPRGEFKYTRPVMVLAGRGVLSASETFVSAMRELPSVTILGDTTGGSSGNPGQHRLRAWSYTVPRWIEWTADRRIIEWNGIPPDSVIRWNPLEVTQGHDPVIAAAMARLARR